jgi:magnesium chelatase subunit D
MTDRPDGGAGLWADAVLAAALFAVGGPGLGGVRLRARAGPVRDRWLEILRAVCPEQPMPRLPLHADADRLAGGLDLAATLRAGRPIGEQGLLHKAHGGALLIAMAERLDPELAAAIGLAMETGRVHGAVSSDEASPASTQFGVVALDEGVEADERSPAGLADRLALHIDLTNVTVRDLSDPAFDAAAVAAARDRLPHMQADDAVIETLCAASLALGIGSLRGPWLAFSVARAAAALDGRGEIVEQDIAIAARLVLGPRATMLPAAEDESEDNAEPPPQDDEAETPDDDAAKDPEQEEGESPPPEEEPAPPEAPEPEYNEDDDDESAPDSGDPTVEQVLEAAQASIPPGLLEGSRAARAGRSLTSSAGKSGAQQRSGVRGRPAGVRRGRPGPQARLNLVETLRAAAPWQRLRAEDGAESSGRPRVQVRQDDFRVTRFKQRRETTTVFVVDASGSAALHRLAEAKGAIELLLADCYVRRDSVALVTFRGTGAEVLLPPTRSLVQAKRRLAELPGGGGTPLAAGLESALELSDGIIRRGATPVIVVLTDGRANIAADGAPGRERAQKDALAAGQRLRAGGMVVLLVDTSPRPRPLAEELAGAMGARYIPLPQADAAHLSAAVRAQTA